MRCCCVGEGAGNSGGMWNWILLGVLVKRAEAIANHITISCLYSIFTYLGTVDRRIRAKLTTKYNFPESRIMHTPFQKKLKSMPQNMPISFLASFKIKIPSDCFDPIFVAKENKENYHDSQQY